MSLNLPLPKQIYAHGWVLMKDGKMSKSKGNIVYPELLIDRYGLDACKYFLMKELSYGQDGVFTPEGFVERYNTELCNDLGNLLNRTVAMVNKYCGGNVPEYLGPKNSQDLDLEKMVLEQVKLAEENIETIHISNALSEIWKIISMSNKYIDETMPWVLAKSEENEDKEKLESVLYHLIENLRKAAILIKPFMEQTSDNILNQLGVTEDVLKTWDSLYQYDGIKNMKVIEKGEPLFVRLDTEKEIEYIKSGM